jgi:hypothetical protein
LNEAEERFNQNKILLIWETPDEVYSHAVMPLKEKVIVTLAGKKPNKIIVPRQINTASIKKIVKKAIAYNGIAISTDGSPIYDGRRNPLEQSQR